MTNSLPQQAVILAGGKGTRLLPLTETVPKPMVTVANKPFLYWQLVYLKKQGIHRVLLLVSHLSEQIEKYFNQHTIPEMTIDYHKEPSPLGTGGALKNAIHKLDNDFWLLNGDSFSAVNLMEMGRQYIIQKWDASILSLEKPDLVSVPANIKIDGDRISSYKKEAGSQLGYNFVDAGVYVLNRKVVEQGPDGAFNIEAYWPDLIQKKKLGAFKTQERFFDIGTPERLKFFEGRIHDYF